jgi:hypothetical protein
MSTRAAYRCTETRGGVVEEEWPAARIAAIVAA